MADLPPKEGLREEEPPETVATLTKHLEALCEKQRLQTLEIKRLKDDFDRLNIALEARKAAESQEYSEATRLRKEISRLNKQNLAAIKNLRRENRLQINGLKNKNKELERKVRRERKSVAAVENGASYRLGRFMLAPFNLLRGRRSRVRREDRRDGK